MSTGHYDEGMAVRREVLGDSYVERASVKTTDFTRDFQQIVTEFAWGTVPAANAAFRVAQRVLEELEQQDDPTI